MDLTPIDVTSLPTPAKDALAAVKEQYDADYTQFISEISRDLSASLTRDQAVAAVSRYVSMEPRATKKEAIAELAQVRWDETDAAKKYNDLSGAARRERCVLGEMTKAYQRVEFARAKVLQAVEEYRYPTDPLEAAADFRAAVEHYGLWWHVAAIVVTHEKTLVEATLLKAEDVKRGLLSTSRNRAMSRSTSVANNLSEDIAREVHANWLDDVDQYLV